MSMIIRWRIKSRDCSIELLMVCWQNDIAQICQNGLRRCCLVEEHAPQRSVPHNAAFWGVFCNRSSAVDANGLAPRGRQANPVLTCETALRRFFRLWRCIAPLVGVFWGDGNPLMEGQPPKDGWIIVAPGWLAYLGLVVE